MTRIREMMRYVRFTLSFVPREGGDIYLAPPEGFNRLSTDGKLEYLRGSLFRGRGKGNIVALVKKGNVYVGDIIEFYIYRDRKLIKNCAIVYSRVEVARLSYQQFLSVDLD
jgi:hypothetical protein